MEPEPFQQVSTSMGPKTQPDQSKHEPLQIREEPPILFPAIADEAIQDQSSVTFRTEDAKPNIGTQQQQKFDKSTAKQEDEVSLAVLLNTAMHCITEEIKDNEDHVKVLTAYIDQIKKPDIKAEVVAIKFLKKYKHDPKFLMESKELQKLLPNINISKEKRLMSLFGVEALDAKNPRNPESKMYTLSPYKYVRAAMINSPSYTNTDDKINFVFQLYDEDGSGKISQQELKDVFTFYGKESQFAFTDEVVEEIANAVCSEIGRDDDGMISPDNFKQFFNRSVGQDAKLNLFERGKANISKKIKEELDFESFQEENHTTARNQQSARDINVSQISCQTEGDLISATRSQKPLSEELKNKKKKKKKTTQLNAFRRFMNLFLVEGIKWIWLILWLVGALYQWISLFFYYHNKTGVLAIGIAKGCAGVVYYNMGIMLFLITKSITTILRKIHLANLLPLNFNVYFHRLLGVTTMACGFSHAIAHISGSYRALSSFKDVDELNKILLTPVPEVRSYIWWLFCSMPSLTGYFILIIMFVMVLFAFKRFRRANFERFWYSHQMWIILFVLLSLHGSKQYIAKQYFIYWTFFPCLILILEKLLTAFSFFSKRFKILDLTFISSGLTELKVSKPPGFKFKAGQYALINIKELSSLQWHPFSISSGPKDDFLTFHISPAGDWTKSLKEYAIKHKKTQSQLPSISLMGPYGAPSQHYGDYKHIMIFCTGVGATPFASILRAFVSKASQAKDLTEYSVEFFWLCRNPSDHGWLSKMFADLLMQENVNKIVKIYMFFTGPHSKSDLRVFLLWHGLNKIHEKGVPVKGLEHLNIMHWGRPDWNEIFERKKNELKRGTVGVFYCGNPFLAKELHEKCNLHSGNVTFKFSKEIF